MSAGSLQHKNTPHLKCANKENWVLYSVFNSPDWSDLLRCWHISCNLFSFFFTAVVSRQWFQMCMGMSHWGLLPAPTWVLLPPPSPTPSPPLFTCAKLPYSGLSAPQALEHFVFVFQLQGENRASLALAVFSDVLRKSDIVSRYKTILSHGQLKTQLVKPELFTTNWKNYLRLMAKIWDLMQSILSDQHQVGCHPHTTAFWMHHHFLLSQLLHTVSFHL